MDDIVINWRSCDDVKALTDEASRTMNISWQTYSVLGRLLLVLMLIIAAILLFIAFIMAWILPAILQTQDPSLSSATPAWYMH